MAKVKFSTSPNHELEPMGKDGRRNYSKGKGVRALPWDFDSRLPATKDNVDKQARIGDLFRELNEYYGKPDQFLRRREIMQEIARLGGSTYSGVNSERRRRKNEAI